MTFVEVCKNRFMMKLLQNPPIYSSTNFFVSMGFFTSLSRLVPKFHYFTYFILSSFCEYWKDDMFIRELWLKTLHSPRSWFSEVRYSIENFSLHLSEYTVYVNLLSPDHHALTKVSLYPTLHIVGKGPERSLQFQVWDFYFDFIICTIFT